MLTQPTPQSHMWEDSEPFDDLIVLKTACWDCAYKIMAVWRRWDISWLCEDCQDKYHKEYRIQQGQEDKPETKILPNAQIKLI